MVGAIVLATHQGLGYLAKDFFDNGVVDKVLIKHHGSRENHPEWYGNKGKWLQPENYEWFFNGLDSVIYFEDPFEWKLLIEARKRGIKNVLCPMHECTRFPFPYEPDLLLCPSLIEMDLYKGKNTVFAQIPVKEEWKLREKARVFVHNAGNGGLGGRNGTKELIEAMKYVKSPIKLIIRSQSVDLKCDDQRVEIRKGQFEHKDLYNEGDIFIFPEKFNGLSLPIQEAYASGMPIMSTNRYPFNTWLPNELLIPVKGYKKETIAVEFDSAIIDPKDIAETIDRWYNKDITKYSLMGKEWGEKNSWTNLKKEYGKILSSL
jgi:glycosyltransferase involved in cell wall biosynthesis